MKNHQLLLFVLLFTSNGLIITQNSENIHPASIKNIENPDNKERVGKFDPSTPTNPTSIKNIEKLGGKTPTVNRLNTKLMLNFPLALNAGLTSFLATKIASTLVKKSLSPSATLTMYVPGTMYAPGMTLEASWPPSPTVRVIMFCTGISYILYKTEKIQKTIHKIIANKEINRSQLLVLWCCNVGFLLASSSIGVD